MEEIQIVLPDGISATEIDLVSVNSFASGAMIYTFHYVTYEMVAVGSIDRWLQYNTHTKQWRIVKVLSQEAAYEGNREESSGT